jgi:hypothetical protein
MCSGVVATSFHRILPPQWSQVWRSAAKTCRTGRHSATRATLLLEHGVTPNLARVCRSHSQWDRMTVSLEELVVALADKLWKGVRKRDLEERVVDRVAAALATDRWNVFLELDTLFERRKDQTDSNAVECRERLSARGGSNR